VKGPATRYTPRVEAYEAYLKGRYFTWAFALNKFREARGCFEEAIRLDPQYALPHAALAEHFHIAGSGFMDRQQASDLGLHAAEQALAKDPTLPEANAWRGIYAIMRDYDWQAADRWFRVALAQPVVAPEIWHMAGYFHLRVVGRAEEAVAAHRRAIEEDPLNLIIRVGHAVSLRAAGRDREAADEARRILDINPEYTAAYTLQALDVTAVPPDEALAYAEKAVAIAPPWTRPLVGLLAGVLSRQGRDQRAREVMATLDPDEFGGPAGFTTFHALRNEPEEAAAWFERSIDQGHQYVQMLFLTPPYLRVLRASRRWPALARRLNLSETS
jgi:tetratricopeptide (TPR) repeat protein